MDVCVSSFISAYTAADEARIAFRWVKLDSEELTDPNYDFRAEVAAVLLAGELKGPDELVRDIFLAEASLCKAVWAAGQQLTDLGTLLLAQTGAKYLDAFFEGKEQSFDTDCCVVCDNVPSHTLQRIVNELKQKQSSDDLQSKIFLDYFQDQLERAANENSADA
ncbi:MAG: hypothetical protein AAGL17_17200 [Cyanobacteria bacterium J06576_12]